MFLQLCEGVGFIEKEAVEILPINESLPRE
jgi:hypothetical protein